MRSLAQATVVADNAAFIGDGAGQAMAIADRLAGGRSDLAGLVKVAPGVEIRSVASPDATLKVANDWNLAPAGTRVGEPMTLTLRSAGDLLVANTLSDGFSSAASNGLARTDDAASFRLVGGADFASADPLAVRVGADAGDVVIGRAATGSGGTPPTVLVRTTTGSIDVAAARDVTLANSQARVYTTGTPVAKADVPGFERIGFQSGQLLANNTATLSPFFENAGDVRIDAGRDVIGAPATVYGTGGVPTSTQYVTDWWFRQTGTDPSGNNFAASALWSRYDLFAEGVASFGGGDVHVRAARDIVDLEASTPASGYAVAAQPASDSQAALPAQQRWFAGGDLSVAAGRDVVSGLYNAGGPTAALQAGRAIVGSGTSGLGQSNPVTQLFYLDTRWRVDATGDVMLGSPTNPALFTGTTQGSGLQLRETPVLGLAPSASLDVTSVAGDVTLTNLRPELGARAGLDDVNQTVPDELRVHAPAGAITAGTLIQRPIGEAALELLAEDTLTIDNVKVAAAPATAALPLPEARIDAVTFFDPATGAWSRTASGGLDATDRSPVRLVSQSGDVAMTAASLSARPVRLVAGLDVRFESEIRVQHQPVDAAAGAAYASETSLVQAGRDVRSGSGGSIRLGGPGDLVVAAGRDIDFGRGVGIFTVGNQDNPRALPAGGAGVTLLAGVRLGNPDFRQAVADGFQLLGADRLDEHAAELATYFAAVAAGGAPADPTTAAARSAAAQFRALTAQQQLDKARTLAGDAAYRQAVAVRMRQRPGGAGSSDDAAVAAFDALSADARKPLLAPLVADLVTGLAAVWPDAQRSAFGTAVVQARLIDFVERQTGATGLDTAAATAAFAALPPERQALLLDTVLFAELRAAGRSASSLAGAERDAAYQKGYDAIDALFPGTRADGSISLAGSTLRTQQGGDLRLLVPGGGINVGDLGSAANTKSASALGILTVAGGAIEAMAASNVDVNQSRVFTLQQGDLLLWSSQGNLDAGRGAKTVTGAPPPVYTIDANGNLVVDTSGSFSGSGIAVLDAGSSLDLYAPKGEINAGDAGIRASGNAFFGAVRFVGADNLAVGGLATGAPPPVVTGGTTAGLAPLGQSATAAGTQAADSQSDDDARKRRRRRNLLLDFLGFGSNP